MVTSSGRRRAKGQRPHHRHRRGGSTEAHTDDDLGGSADAVGGEDARADDDLGGSADAVGGEDARADDLGTAVRDDDTVAADADSDDALSTAPDDSDEGFHGIAPMSRPPPRRSGRLASTEELPQEVMRYQRFRGVLHTQSKTIPAFSTRVDMTDETDPTPLLLEAPSVPTPTPHDPQKLPKSFAQILAITDKDERGRRLKAYYKEYDGLMEAPSGFRVVPKPSEPHRTLKLKEIPSTKKDGRAKLRVVARGDLLQQGIDYGRTFSPTVKHTTLRMACAIAARRNQTIYVTQAYVLEDWPTDEPTTYADRFPDGYESTTADGTPLALEIGNLYGKPTAGRNWYKKASKALMDGFADSASAHGGAMSFRRSEHDWSYFWRWEGEHLMQVIPRR